MPRAIHLLYLVIISLLTFSSHFFPCLLGRRGTSRESYGPHLLDTNLKHASRALTRPFGTAGVLAATATTAAVMEAAEKEVAAMDGWLDKS